MKRSGKARPRPPQSATRKSLPKKRRHSTVTGRNLPKLAKPRLRVPKPAPGSKPAPPPKRQVARIVDQAESSLIDIIDNLLSKGVMLNADLILALANVDLVYVRLSALLCAADRVLPTARRRQG